MANKARDLILAVIDGTPYENGKLKPAVRELDEYIEGLEARCKQLEDLKPLLFVVDMFEKCSENQEQWSGPAQAVFNAVREWRKARGSNG